MRRSQIFILLVALGAAIVITLAVFSSNWWVAGSIPAFVKGENDPEKIDKYSHYLDTLVTAMDQLVSMLVTVQLSLFVLAGFALNNQLRKIGCPSATLMGFGGIFVLTALMSLTLGYTARIQTLTLIQSGAWHLESAQTTVVSESILVVFSAVAAVCMMLAALLDEGGAMESPRAED